MKVRVLPPVPTITMWYKIWNKLTQPDYDLPVVQVMLETRKGRIKLLLIVLCYPVAFYVGYHLEDIFNSLDKLFR